MNVSSVDCVSARIFTQFWQRTKIWNGKKEKVKENIAVLVWPKTSLERRFIRFNLVAMAFTFSLGSVEEDTPEEFACLAAAEAGGRRFKRAFSKKDYPTLGTDDDDDRQETHIWLSKHSR